MCFHSELLLQGIYMDKYQLVHVHGAWRLKHTTDLRTVCLAAACVSLAVLW
jgi:hypothetical protein